MHNYIENKSGNMSMMLAVSALVLCTGIACAVDYSVWQSQRNKLQDAADASALSGAIKLANGGRNVEQSAEAEAYKYAKAANDTSLDGFESKAIVDALTETVQVNLSVPVPRLFSSFLIADDPVINVHAIAKVVNDGVYCIYALNPTAPAAIDGNGNAVLRGDNCSIHAASNSPSGITNSGTMTADDICVVGNYTGSGYSPTPTPNCAPAGDPLAALSIPSPGVVCDFTGLSVNVNTTLQPGNYCGGIKVSSQDVTVTLSPGEYFLVDGDLKVTAGGNVVGDEVVFILSGTASIDISGHGVVSTTPPISGALEGFSVVQERTAPLGKVSKITGEGRFEFPGIIYMPRQALDIAGQAVGNASTPTYAAIIVDTLKISGSGELIASADTSSFSQASSSKLSKAGARLVE